MSDQEPQMVLSLAVSREVLLKTVSQTSSEFVEMSLVYIAPRIDS